MDVYMLVIVFIYTVLVVGLMAVSGAAFTFGVDHKKQFGQDDEHSIMFEYR